MLIISHLDSNLYKKLIHDDDLVVGKSFLLFLCWFEFDNILVVILLLFNLEYILFLFVKLSNIYDKSYISKDFEFVPIAKYSPFGLKQQHLIGLQSSITFFKDNDVMS